MRPWIIRNTGWSWKKIMEFNSLLMLWKYTPLCHTFNDDAYAQWSCAHWVGSVDDVIAVDTGLCYCSCARRKTGSWWNEWVDEWMDEWVDGWTSGWMNELVGEWMSGWMDGWMNEWVNERMNEWNVEKTAFCYTKKEVFKWLENLN
jgi:hypothetical protein